MSASSSGKVQGIVHVLRARYGKIDWWPGGSRRGHDRCDPHPRTRWENVVRALAELQSRDLCAIAALGSADIHDIEKAVRCTGFFRLKARRLKALVVHIREKYRSIEAMDNFPTGDLRADLLSVNGIGGETADSILCYGFSRPSFVIDAYTEKILLCNGIQKPLPAQKSLFEHLLPCDNAVYRETHAHIVEYAKEFCIKKRCESCILVSSSG